MTIIYATTNPGKFSEAKKNFADYGITIMSPLELGITLDVDEHGSSLEENAILKAEAYLPLVSPGTIILGDDTGIFIDALGGEPGIKVRRWKGYKMTDEEIISHCLTRLALVPPKNRTVNFRIAIAVACATHKTQVFTGDYHTYILEKARDFREPGFPFRPLISDETPTHRTEAIKAALPYLSTLQS